MAVDFDGTDDYVDCGSGATIDDLVDKTVALWFNLDSFTPTQYPTLAFKGLDSSARGWLLNLRGPSAPGSFNVIQFYQYFDVSDGYWTCPLTVTAGLWYHVAIAYNKSSITNDPIMYVNGVSQTVTEVSTPAGTADSDAADSLTLGDRPANPTRFDGKMEDVRVCNRILTAREAAILAAGYRGPLGGEVLWLTMQDFRGIFTPDGAVLAAANVLKDLSGNGNDGVPTNSPVARASTARRFGIGAR